MSQSSMLLPIPSRAVVRRVAFIINVFAVTCSIWAAQYDSPYADVLFGHNVMIAMRDGTKLATDIYRPGRNGTPISDRLPVLLQRTPYNKEGQGLVDNAKFFVRHGYVVALQDIRGRYKSEG